jgi:hypothetical protein
MENAERVTVFHGGDELPEVSSSMVFSKLFFAGYFFEEFAGGGEFNDEVNFVLRCKDFEQVDDVRVVETAEN